MIDFDADMGPFVDYAAMVSGITTTVDSDIYVNQIMDGLYNALARQFNYQFFAVAKADPHSYHHVFEWGTLQDAMPIPLYRINKEGRGKKKMVNFHFIPSSSYIPEPTPNSTGVSQEELDKLSGRRYKFRNKAAVMEFGLSVHIRAKHAKKLFIPARGSDKGFVFANSVTVQNPGGAQTRGSFTSFWESWWAGVAPTLVAEEVAEIEKNIKIAAEISGRSIRRSANVKTKSFALRQNPLYAKARFDQLKSASKYAEQYDNDWDEE